jgi:hypothetical protein
MGQKLRGCPVENLVSGAPCSLARDMGTYRRHYFFLFILDMNIILGAGAIPRQNGGI